MKIGTHPVTIKGIEIKGIPGSTRTLHPLMRVKVYRLILCDMVTACLWIWIFYFHYKISLAHRI